MPGRVSESEDDDEERRGSIPFLSSRRGSKLQDILKYNQEKKRKNKRYKDKEGFVWRRMIPDQEFPVSRTPQPHLPDSSRLILPPQPPQPNPRYNPKMQKISSIDVEGLDSLELPVSDFRTRSQDASLPPAPGSKQSRYPRDPETCSLRSVHSENSFKTCSSEPELNLVPRAVSDNYSAPNERSMQDRKASVRAFKNQYSVLNSVNSLGPVPVNQSKSYSKSPRPQPRLEK
jgi:hypothetical protein